MFDYNLSQGYEMAKMRQEMLLAEFQSRREERLLAQNLLKERANERRFRIHYLMRHWLHRVSPALARVML
ncbi:MAG: hypothetical protein K0R39_3924 [Symbiobacteriaceae bacterium]|jgi:hypothetical protein|nr:hypothetical protein [Symbiobacteriaceae bacterium]